MVVVLVILSLVGHHSEVLAVLALAVALLFVGIDRTVLDRSLFVILRTLALETPE